MSYETVEDGLLTLLRRLSIFDATNTSQSDYRILNRAKNRFVILNPGRVMDHEAAATGGTGGRRMRTRWIVNVSLIIPWRGEVSTIRDRIRDDRQTLMDHLDAFPTANEIANVIQFGFLDAGEPEHWIGAERNQWHQLLRYWFEERFNVAIQEPV
jgi:hypothetical protein